MLFADQIEEAVNEPRRPAIMRPLRPRDRPHQAARLQSFRSVSTIERVYNQVWPRKLLILVVLALIWEA